MEVIIIKICYIGNDILFNAEVEQVDCIEKNMFDAKDMLNMIADVYDVVVVEVPTPLNESAFRWFFDLKCKGKISILALGNKCNLSDRLLLSKFGVDSYVERDDLSDIKYHLDVMSKKIKILNELSNNTIPDDR